MAKKFNGQAIKLDHYVEQAEHADIIITSTGAPHYIIGEKEAKRISALRHGRPIVMIDIAEVPRDIDPVVCGYRRCVPIQYRCSRKRCRRK